MRRRGFFGSVGDDELVVKAPKSASSDEPILPASHPEQKKRLRKRAIEDVKRNPRYRRVTILRAVAGFLVARTFFQFVAGAGVITVLMYDALQHQGTWRATAEEYGSVFGAIFGLFLWRWSRQR